MAYHLEDHIYLCQFRDDIIILDLLQDKYVVCMPELARVLLDIFSNSDNPDALSSQQDLTSIQCLVESKIIKKTDVPYPYYIDYKPYSCGVQNVDWVLPLNNGHFSLDRDVLKAFLMLIKVHSYMKYRGFYSVIRLIKNKYSNQLNYRIPTAESLENLANSVNKAAAIYLTRVKCLEWSIVFVLLALQKQWKCNLEIGVQNYPFFAHAWVECDGKIIMDAQSLRDGLAIILAEPFRKLKR